MRSGSHDHILLASAPLGSGSDAPSPPLADCFIPAAGRQGQAVSGRRISHVWALDLGPTHHLPAVDTTTFLVGPHRPLTAHLFGRSNNGVGGGADGRRSTAMHGRAGSEIPFHHPPAAFHSLSARDDAPLSPPSVAAAAAWHR